MGFLGAVRFLPVLFSLLRKGRVFFSDNPQVIKNADVIRKVLGPLLNMEVADPEQEGRLERIEAKVDRLLAALEPPANAHPTA